ncbi:hypothetical protein, partial [Gordonia aichiensis]|uniref:hypothetical protein n=1 Tax=Gordonia aichiensis TaxID=36820 RepID=UPI001C3F2FC2
MLAAARVAGWHYDFGLAERMVESVLNAQANFDARILQAQLASLRGKTREAADMLSALAEAARTPHEVFRVAVARLDHRTIYAGAVDEGLSIAHAAEKVLAGTPQADDIPARRAALVLGNEGPASALPLWNDCWRTPRTQRSSGRACRGLTVSVGQGESARHSRPPSLVIAPRSSWMRRWTGIRVCTDSMRPKPTYTPGGLLGPNRSVAPNTKPRWLIGRSKLRRCFLANVPKQLLTVVIPIAPSGDCG